MAITTPNKLTITKESEFVFTPMAVDPLKTALMNSNHLYSYFTPNLLSFMPTGGSDGRGFQYIVPVCPSADGLQYDVWVTLLPTATTAITVTVDKNTGTNPTSGWSTSVATTSLFGFTAGVWASKRVTPTLAANVTMLRITLGSSAAYTVGHVAVHPLPGSPSAGIKACGFIPFDDSVFSGYGAAVNTELVDRSRTNALSVLRDRQQCLASFVQPWHATPFTNGPFVVSLPAYSYEPTRLIGKAVASVPGQVTLTATVYAIASVDGGATADLITVSSGNTGVSLPATGQLVSTTLNLHADGTQTATVPFEIRVKAHAGQMTYLQALVVMWRPGD